MRRTLAVALGLLLTLTACGSDAPPGPGTRAEPHVVASYADDVLISIHRTEGNGAPGAPVPDVEVRTDGTVFLSSDAALGVDTFTLSAAGLDRVRDAFAGVSLDDADYERSAWTDQPITTVYATLAGRPEQISVDGFGSDDEVEDDDWRRLADALSVLDDLADAAGRGTDRDIKTRRTSYRPAHVALVLRPTDAAGGAPWPFAAPLTADRLRWTGSDACIVLGGRDVATLAAIAERDRLDDLDWVTGDPRPGVPSSVEAVAHPILRGAPSPCTTAPTGQGSSGG